MSFFFFFKQKTAYEMRISDWSSDVCSSDLVVRQLIVGVERDVMGLAVHAVDDQIAPVAQLVGQPLRGHAADDGSAVVARLEHRQLARLAAHGPLYGADDVATLAQRAQSLFRVGMDGPRSEEHTSELQSLMRLSYAVLCLKKKN